MEAKLARIKELIERKEEVDGELAELLGGEVRPRRKRRTKEEMQAAQEEPA
jgi:hypothetical protein